MPDSRAGYVLNVPNKIQIEFVKIPGGSFTLGNDEADVNGWTDNNPLRQITLGEFWIGRYTITDADYFIFTGEAHVRRPAHWDQPKFNPARMRTPLVDVSANEANAFCDWLSLFSNRRVRLPSEEEWEAAARGPAGWIYPWGNTWFPNSCNGNILNAIGKLMPVGSYSPGSDSPYGAADMAGNVWEWTSSVYADWTPRQVVRGGCYSSTAIQCRSTYRYNMDPTYRGSTVGFRVVME